MLRCTSWSVIGRRIEDFIDSHGQMPDQVHGVKRCRIFLIDRKTTAPINGDHNTRFMLMQNHERQQGFTKMIRVDMSSKDTKDGLVDLR